MAQGTVGWRIGRLSLLCAATLMIWAVPHASAAEPAPCRVRNVTQDTPGRSLIKMVEKALEGDRLRVHGTCRGPVVIDADLVIRGAGDQPTLAGRGPGQRGRVVRITSGAEVVLRDLIVERGSASEGGGIRNVGSLRLVGVTVRRNNAGNGGGGIFSTGPLTMLDSVVRGNHSWYAGGLHLSGPATLTRTKVVGNTASDQGPGGGILNDEALTLVESVVSRNTVDYGGGGGIDNAGTLTLIDSVVRNNLVRLALSQPGTGWGKGGGILNSAELALVGSTVTGNASGAEGGGIFNLNGTVTLDAASSVTGNTPDDCVGAPAC